MTFFGVFLVELILRHTDNLSKTLQAPSISAAVGQKITAMTVKTLSSLRTDENFDLFWQRVKDIAKHESVDDAALPRRRKPPARYI